MLDGATNLRNVKALRGDMHMSRYTRFATLTFTALCLCAGATQAQLPQTRLYVVDPPGAQVGSFTEVTVARGDDLDEVDELHFNHPGIFATQVTQPSANGPQPVANKFRVAVADDVPPGRYEVRASGLYGLSNPRTFMIGRRAEIKEAEPNNDAANAKPVDVGTVVNGLINGAGDIDVFKFAATAGQRIVIDVQSKRIDSKLDPQLTLQDASGRPLKFARSQYGPDDLLVFDVPADGEYLIELRDLAFTGSADHVYRLAIHTDPQIRFSIPAAGQAGTTGKFTLYGYNLPGGERTESVSAGAPLEKLTVDIPIPARDALPGSLVGVPSHAAGLDLFAWHLEADGRASNTIHLGVTDAAPTAETEPNDEPAAANAITAPADVTGQLATVKDIDTYAIDAKANEEFQIEVIAHRGGALIDAVLKVQQVTKAEDGSEQVKELTTQDDFTTNLAALTFDTATDDPVFRLKAPVDGTYRISVRDRAYEHNADPSLVYRLTVHKPQPDFRLVAVPSGSAVGLTWPVGLRRGDHFAIDVLVHRQDGFNGPIEIDVPNLPFGFETEGVTILEGETTGTLVLTSTGAAPPERQFVEITGTAKIDRGEGPQPVSHKARAGSVVWNRADKVPSVARLTDTLTLSVMDEPAPFVVSHDVPQIEVCQGRQILVPLTLSTNLAGEPVQVLGQNYELKPQGEQKPGIQNDLVLKPAGLPKEAKIEAGDVTIPKEQTAQTMRLFVAADSPPKTYKLMLSGTVAVPYRRNPAKAIRAEGLKARAVAEENELKALVEQATTQVASINTRLEQAAQQITQAQAAVTTKEQELATANTLVAQLAAEREAAMKTVASLTDVEAKAIAFAEAAQKAAEGSTAAVVKEQSTLAQQSVTKAAEVLAATKASVTELTQKHDAAVAQVKPATDALAAAKEAVPKVQATQTALQAEKSAAEALVAERTAAVAPATKAREEAEKVASAAAEASKPNNLNVTQTLPPIVIVVNPAPVQLAAALSAAEVKKGATIDATVTITRQNDFTGPVTLSLVEGGTQLTAPEVSVPADQTTGVLKLTAPAEAAPGDVANLVVRAKVDHNGEALVDVPIKVKIIE